MYWRLQVKRNKYRLAQRVMLNKWRHTYVRFTWFMVNKITMEMVEVCGL